MSEDHLRRFIAKVHVEPNSGCWLWLGKVGRDGYGRTTQMYRQMMAHRAAYEHYVGPISSGLHVDHLCRTRCCVNPGHLEPVTVRENILRGTSTIAMCARRETCAKGHAMVPDKYRQRRGRHGRRCLTCDAAHARDRYWRAKAQEARS